MVKSAFTMIELIFAIVIIGISVMSLPVVINITNKSIENNLVQEAIFASSTELIGATAGYWDERSMEDEMQSHISRVVNISADCDNITKLRPGHIAQPYHRRCLDNNSSTGLNYTINSSIFSLNDATHDYENIFINSTTDATGYKQTYTSKIDIIQTNNIKKITVTIKDENNNIVTLLRSQSANIGETDYYKRMF